VNQQDKKPNSKYCQIEDGTDISKRQRNERKQIMAQVARAITVIPATINPVTRMANTSMAKRRVAGYARVSTDSEEQLTSYEAQVDYYTRYIQGRSDWQFVEVYTDEGISATNTKKRDGFNRMVGDALEGKIDLIVTKSVSRFARNTVDSLTTVRKLKEAGVEVYFEKENIWTLDSKGELLITIMSSLAQEESRSISENVTWGQRKRFADGKISIPYGQFLGYRKGSDGLPEIVPGEAETVRRIYRLFMQGKTPNAIAKLLTAEGVPTPGGKKVWQFTTVESILANEKYKGAALLQKKFTVDFLQKKMKVNEGEVPQYYVENSHPPIIQPDEWDRVQAEFQRRKSQGKNHNCNRLFSAQIVCGDCGEYYGSKVWHSNSKYRRVIWQCNSKFKGDHKCRTPHLYDTDIQRLFMSAVSKLFADRKTILETCRLLQSTLTDNTSIDAECDELLREMDVVAGLIRSCIEENAAQAFDQASYLERYNGYVERYEFLKERYAKLQGQRESRDAEALRIGGFMFELRELDELPVTFDERLWHGLIDHVTVYDDERLVFHFKDGSEITEQL
jgi:DNA invertase Pin-like site-specific DNA recombinase